MGSAYIPNQNFFENYSGYNNTQGGTLLLEINGVVYPNGFRVTYPGGYRNFYASRNNTGAIYISCQTIAYGQDLPEYVLPAQGTRILIVGSSYNQRLAAPVNVAAYTSLDYEDQNIIVNLSCNIVPNAETYSIYLKTFGPGTDPITLTNPVIWEPLALGMPPQTIASSHYFNLQYVFDWFNVPATATIKIAGVNWEGVEGLPGFVTFTPTVP